MKRYSAAEFRQKLAGALDEVERGEEVVVERRGRRFKIVPAPPPKWPKNIKPFFKVIDPALFGDDWGWEYEPGKDLRFVPHYSRKRKKRT